MNTPRLLLAALAGSIVACVHAQDTVERNATLAFTAPARLAEGSRRFADTGATQFRLAHDAAVAFDDGGKLLAGLALARRQFDAPADAPVPTRLHAVAFTLGWRQPVSERASWQVEARPGLYGEKFGGGFDVPVSVRFLRASSATLQWAVGLDYDPRSGHPLLGGVGVRWQFAPQWTLVALPPAPRVEYAVTRDVTCFAGAELQHGAYRLASDFGQRHARPALDRAVVDYREIVVQIGARWRTGRNMELAADLGWLVDRRFAFHDQDLLIHGAGAPQFRLALTQRR